MHHGILRHTYHVSGYPMFYAVDGEGRIIHRHSGYGRGMEDMLATMNEEDLQDAEPTDDDG